MADYQLLLLFVLLIQIKIQKSNIKSKTLKLSNAPVSPNFAFLLLTFSFYF